MDISTVLTSLAAQPEAWRATPAQCLIKNGSLRVWIRDGLRGYSVGSNITADNGHEIPEEKKVEFSAALLAWRRARQVSQFPYPRRTLEEIEVEEKAAERAKNIRAWEPVENHKYNKPPADWDGGDVIYRSGGIGQPFRWSRYKGKEWMCLDVMYYFAKTSDEK